MKFKLRKGIKACEQLLEILETLKANGINPASITPFVPNSNHKVTQMSDLQLPKGKTLEDIFPRTPRYS